jgi:hypothetical protein
MSFRNFWLVSRSNARLNRLLVVTLLGGLVALSLFGGMALFVGCGGNSDQTTASNYYVSMTGNDNNSGTSLPEACLTIQGALNKIPKRLTQVVTVTVLPGNYEGFVLEGFTVYPSASGPRSGSGAGLIIQGTTKGASPKTGRASGTVSSCNAGGRNAGGLSDPNTHASLTDLTQMWTPHDANLRGRKLCLTTKDTNGQPIVECLTIEDNDATTITLAGYWGESDFHHGWSNGLKGDTYEITEPDTHLNKAVPLHEGVGGVAQGQGSVPRIAAILVSNVHGGASAAALDQQAADNFQILIKDFDVLAEDLNGIPVPSVAYVDSSDHIGFKHFTTGINTVGSQPHPGLYTGAGLFIFRNSTAWTVQSSYANGDAPASGGGPSSPMIASSWSATADTVIGVFGNVVDNMPAYFGDEASRQTTSHTSVIFGGESIRDTGGNADAGGSSAAAIWIQSAARVHLVGTQINGSRIKDPQNKARFYADGVRLGDAYRLGFGIAYFEGGDISNCSGSGINIAGNWNAAFITGPFTSAAGPNGQFGIEAANGAKVVALNYVYNEHIDPMNRLRGGGGDLSFDGQNRAAFFSYSDVFNAPGRTITEPQRGGLFSFYNGEAASATSAVPPTWISFGQGVVHGFTSQSGDSYSANKYDHVIGMSKKAPRTVTLPIPEKRSAGTHYVVIDTSHSDGSETPKNTITVTPPPGSPPPFLINDAANALITPGENKALEVISDGTNYWIISLK